MSAILDHQVRELKEAINQTINIENNKARLDVQAIIRDGLDNNKKLSDILSDLLDWTGTNTWQR